MSKIQTSNETKYLLSSQPQMDTCITPTSPQGLGNTVNESESQRSGKAMMKLFADMGKPITLINLQQLQLLIQDVHKLKPINIWGRGTLQAPNPIRGAAGNGWLLERKVSPYCLRGQPLPRQIMLLWIKLYTALHIQYTSDSVGYKNKNRVHEVGRHGVHLGGVMECSWSKYDQNILCV